MTAKNAVRGAPCTILNRAAGVRLSEGHGLPEPLPAAPKDYAEELIAPARPARTYTACDVILIAALAAAAVAGLWMGLS